MISMRHIAALTGLLGASTISHGASALPNNLEAIFEFTGDAQHFVVPDRVTSLDLDACGAQGGDNNGPAQEPEGIGGFGGRSFSTITVTPGETLVINVGGDGDVGGWNGGGLGGVVGVTPVDLASGGGASDVRQGGTGLEHRVVIGAGGGGGGETIDPLSFETTGLNGGIGGETGGGNFPGTPFGPGIDPLLPELSGALGLGGHGELFSAIVRAGGGGGGLYGGAGGRFRAQVDLIFEAGSGGSGLGDPQVPGACAGSGLVQISWDAPPVQILPSGGAVAEGNAGTSTAMVPVRLSEPAGTSITVQWRTLDMPAGPGLAEPGTDFIASSGTLLFLPGETELFVPIEIIGDTDEEEPLLWGEWGLIEFNDASPESIIDTEPFFGLGLFVIIDDDIAP